MKTFLFAFVILIINGSALWGQNGGVAVNTSGVAADPSAALDISSNNQGLLIPRMSEGERVSLPNLATGLLVYQTDGIPGFWFYDGSFWKQFPWAGSAPGDIPYWDGIQWAVLPAGASGDFLQFTGSGIPGWGPGATPP